MKKKPVRNKSSRTRRGETGITELRIYFIGAFFAAIFIGLFVFLRFSTSKETVCANSISCVSNLSGEYESNATRGMFLGRTVEVPNEVAQDFVNSQVLGADAGPKRIEVDLTNQKLYAFSGSQLVYDFLISSGKWHHTPTGTFHIWIKLRYTRMTGGIPSIGTFYDLPNVPYTMYFYGGGITKADGYGLHGAYWHNNFGHPMSHGCVNLSISDSALLYAWADPPTTGNVTYASDGNQGTPIMIYGDTPVD